MEKHVHFFYNIGLEMAKMHLKQFGKIGLVKGHVFRKDADPCLHTQNAERFFPVLAFQFRL